MAVMAGLLPAYERQFEFAKPINKRWKADFAFVDQMLLIEVDGGIWVNGKHVRSGSADNERIRQNAATCLGYAVLRFTPKMLDNAVDTIVHWMEAHG